MPLIPLLEALRLCRSEMPSMLYPEKLEGEMNLQPSSGGVCVCACFLGGYVVLIAEIMVH